MPDFELVPMRAISLWQPWASLIALGAKTIETRSWATWYRGPIAIHAAKTAEALESMMRATAGPSVELRSVLRHHGVGCCGDLPLGAVVATALLVDCVPIIDSDSCEWHSEHPRGVAACAHAAIDGQVIVHTPDGRYHTTVVVESAFGDYRSGRWAWLLSDIVPLEPPIPAKGRDPGPESWDPSDEALARLASLAAEPT